MKKFTKRLTMIVAVLLSLVLLSSSIVSTTLAKYVITKDATTSVGLEKFGLTVTLNHANLGKPTETKTGDSVTYTFSSVSLVPSDTAKTLTATVTGHTTVKTNVMIDVVIDYDKAKFKVPANTFTGVTTDKYYVPLIFKVGSTNVYTGYQDTADTALEAIVEGKMADQSTALTYDETKDIINAVYDADKDVSLSAIGFSFYWPTSNVITDGNEIGTWIANHNSPTVTISYTITVSQN